MKYVRGNREDYDLWAKLGNPNWHFEEVLFYFKKSENYKAVILLILNNIIKKTVIEYEPNFYFSQITEQDLEYHGTEGYQTVEQFPYEDPNVNILMNAWNEIGYETVDVNKGGQVGVTKTPNTATDGVRQSANSAFIKPIRGNRTNLVIETNAQVTKILIDAKTKKVTGVEYLSPNGKPSRINYLNT